MRKIVANHFVTINKTLKTRNLPGLHIYIKDIFQPLNNQPHMTQSFSCDLKEATMHV